MHVRGEGVAGCIVASLLKVLPPTHTCTKVKKQRQSASKVLDPHLRKASQLRKLADRTERVELWGYY